MSNKAFDWRNTRTNFRITRALLNGCNVDAITKVLDGHELGHVRAIVRAARVCPSVTPLAYYDSLKWAVAS